MIKLLKDVCQITSGKHQPKVEEAKFWNNESGFSWLRIGDLTSHITTTTKKLSQLGIETKKNGLFLKNTICVATRGATLGKIGWLDIDAYSSSYVINFDTENKNILMNRFLYFYFLTKRKAIFLLKTGTSTPMINKPQLENLKIPLPPIKEQQEIVEKLEIIEKIDQYKMILKQKQELIDIMFKKSLFIIFNNKINNYDFNLLKDVCRITSGKHQPKVEEPKFWDNENGFPWLRIGDLKSHITTTKNKLSQLGIETKKNGLFKKETTVLALVGIGSIGKVGWLNRDFFSSSAVANVISKDKSIILNRYLYFYFLQKRKRIDYLRNGTTGLACVKIYQLNRLPPPPLVTINKQQEIVNLLNILEQKKFLNNETLIKMTKLLDKIYKSMLHLWIK